MSSLMIPVRRWKVEISMMVNGYDALVEVYCVLLLERRDVSELHVLSEQAWFLCYKTTIGSSPDTRRWKYEFDS